MIIGMGHGQCVPPSIALTYHILLHFSVLLSAQENLCPASHPRRHNNHHGSLHVSSDRCFCRIISLYSNYKSTSKTLRICNSTLNAHISLPLSQKCDMLCPRDIAMGCSRGIPGRFSVYPWFYMGTKYDYCRQRNWQWKCGLFNSIQIVIQF